MKKVAIFDIDGTIFRSSLTIEVTNTLIAEDIFPASTRKSYQRAYENWLNRKDSYDKYIDAVVKAFDKHIKGVPRVDFLRIARQVVAYQQHRVYRFTRDMVRTLRKRGYFLIAISHSPTDVVGEFAKRWGFHRVYGLGFELDKHGKFTGRITFDKFLHDKAKILQHAVATEKLSLKGSIGVGDSEGDIPMLKLVDRPICFNPNSVLYRYAKRSKWEIVVERKDVIYKI
ncbi:MAG: HAD-IB family hydrolase [Patescibacteria group bacterium]|jgi:HAD superfamily hydrolase (TIGR01490 family)